MLDRHTCTIFLKGLHNTTTKNLHPQTVPNMRRVGVEVAYTCGATALPRATLDFVGRVLVPCFPLHVAAGRSPPALILLLPPADIAVQPWIPCVAVFAVVSCLGPFGRTSKPLLPPSPSGDGLLAFQLHSVAHLAVVSDRHESCIGNPLGLDAASQTHRLFFADEEQVAPFAARTASHAARCLESRRTS